jgi:putative ATP-dependent endonuclease of OLD family
MYLAELRLWNFRKYGKKIDEEQPGLKVVFNNGLNLLVGENDSGKTAIIDAIKIILNTQSYDYFKIEEKDFYKPNGGHRTIDLKIECSFRGFSPAEAANFLEWITFDNNGSYELILRLVARYKNNRVITDIKAGPDGADTFLDGTARDLLRVTYLKPLRDAEAELNPGYRSRLAQILKSHELFQKNTNEIGEYEDHILEKIIQCANNLINDYFSKDILKQNELIGLNEDITETGKQIRDKINSYLKEFSHKETNYEANINISDVELSDILKKLNLRIDDNISGLGTLNLLFIATELLLLQTENNVGLKLALIEEIEAHLHPQAQLRLIDFLQKEDKKGQFILTTHSTTLASSIKLKHLIICKDDEVFPMGKDFTKLNDEGDYKFLERFLDATKANLFFARGVILVEGDAENLLLPTIAEIIESPLHKYGVSIVNVGSTAFLRYSKIFLRKESPYLKTCVSIITDLDVRPIEYYNDENNKKDEEFIVYGVCDNNIKELKELTNDFDFELIKNNFYPSKTAYEKAINKIKLKKRVSKEIKSQIITKSIIKIDKLTIDAIKASTYQNKKKELEEANVKAFISKNWTLEYELALSDLKDYILKAVIIAERIMENEEFTFSKELSDEVDQEVQERYNLWAGKTPEEIAYNIYQPLLKGYVSKAVTAQYLAQNLLENKITIKNILETDQHLEYLIKAIKYATKGDLP